MFDRIFAMFFSLLLFLIPFGSAAHYITGRVFDARDGESANGKIVFLWKTANGLNDNITDVVGVNGNSETDNTYLIDCEMLNEPCNVDDNVSVMILGESTNISKIVSGFGFDMMDDLNLDSAPNVTSVFVDDRLLLPVDEIDLVPNDTRIVSCEAVVSDADGDGGILETSARLYSVTSSNDSAVDDNNWHYTNSSCAIDPSYGDENQSLVVCNFSIWYYAESTNWICNLTAKDNYSREGYGNDSTFFNGLLALEVGPVLDYGNLGTDMVSREVEINVTNYGNVKINLSIYGYARSEADNFSFNCSYGENISIGYHKYNLTASNLGNLDLSQFEQIYQNLTSEAIVRKFDFDYRYNDAINEAVNKTYWRVYIPAGITAGSCNGNIVFSAVQGGEI